MPLSDHEQRLLEQMERALYQEDPRFASSLRQGRGSSIDRMRIAVGIGIVIVGLVVVVAGVATSLAPIGVAGFAAMVGGAFWAWTGTRQKENGAQVGEAPAKQAKPAKGAGKARTTGDSFMDKMEDRWRKRREGGQ